MRTKRTILSLIISLFVYLIAVMLDTNHLLPLSNKNKEQSKIADYEMTNEDINASKDSLNSSDRKDNDSIQSVSSLFPEELTVLLKNNANEQNDKVKNDSGTIAASNNNEVSENTNTLMGYYTGSPVIDMPNETSTAATPGDSGKTSNTIPGVQKDEAKEDTSDSAAKQENTDNKDKKAVYSDIGISSADAFVFIREEASTDSEALGKLYKDSAAKILKTKGDWYYVESGSVKGYVKSDYLKTGIPDDEIIKKYGTQKISVDVDGLNVRKSPDTESDRIDVIYKTERYPVIEAQKDWVKIKIEDENIIGYVLKDHVDMVVDFKKAVSKEEEEELQQLQQAKDKNQEAEVMQGNSANYSSNDLKLLACLIHAEAGNQSYEGKLAVANVVLNRVKSGDYPDTIKGVIYQSGQFSVADSGSLSKQLSNYDNFDSSSQKLSIKAAKAALNGSNNIGNRKHFNSYHAAVNKGYDHFSSSVKIEDQLFW